MSNIASIEEKRAIAPSKNGNGNGNGARLNQIDQRLTRIETKLDTELKHLATKAWVLAGVVAGMGLAATLTLAIIKLFGIN